MKKAVVFIVPGHNEYTKEGKYQKIAGYFREIGVEPVMVDISWSRRTISENVEQFLKEYSKHQAEKNSFLGFSFGAMVCFIASAKVKVDFQILCSLSPYFAEDLPRTRGWWLKAMGKKRTADFKTLISEDLAKNIKARSVLLVGADESEEILRSNERILRLLKNPKHYIVSGVGHDIGDPNYQKQIEQVIQSFSQFDNK